MRGGKEIIYIRRHNLTVLRNKENPFSYEGIHLGSSFDFQNLYAGISFINSSRMTNSKHLFHLNFGSIFFMQWLKPVLRGKWIFRGDEPRWVGSGIIDHICKLVVKRKHGEVRFPNSVEEYNRIKTGFYSKFGIKGVIGAIDCTHVGIIAPALSNTVVPHDYMNRKGYYSINVEAVCDDELIFRHVNAKFPGSCHDSGIWTTSPARIKFIREHSDGAFKWLLGDSGYPLEPWLLTPVTNPETPNEQNFNTRHIMKPKYCQINHLLKMWEQYLKSIRGSITLEAEQHVKGSLTH
ncbi:putative nuclease HARBI1 [Bactrocera neohumeralis]|uniref:putative nuclease HARBI1 n=1 Tax=Bactrocera neohumeralis TaxID=98809 RepID=UPI002166B15B|nr:putative nuclease HARBI1 [Bactrocera neohumeralis]